jgi:hypothetical protein
MSLYVASGPFLDCPECLGYGERRQDVLPAHIVEVAQRHKVHGGDLFNRYMTGVHERHMAGGSL